MENIIALSPERAYLELARSSLGSAILTPNNGVTPPNIYLAILAQTYVFSCMAMSAFVNNYLGDVWERDDKPLQTEYPKAKDLSDLLKKSDLRELPKAINALCKHLHIQPIHESKPELWKDFEHALRRTRNFLVHPCPDDELVNEILGGAMAKYAWVFPSKVAEQVIAYFFDAQLFEVPTWIRENQEFTIKEIQALSVGTMSGTDTIIKIQGAD